MTSAISAMEERLAREVSGAPLLSRVQRHLVSAPQAKRVRPRLVFACGELVGAPVAELVGSACAVELIHAASLLHDDVVDDAHERRGRAAAHVAYGAPAAVLAGDALLARALALLPPSAIGCAVECIGEMAHAAARELELRAAADADVREVRAVAEGKTAALFALCARIPARVHGVDDAPWERAGRGLGLAFQIRDDVDDLLVDGPERGNDLREGTPTLPIVLAAQADDGVRAALAALWGSAGGDVHALCERIAHGPGVQLALALARTSMQSVLDALAPYRGHPAHDAIIGAARAWEVGRGQGDAAQA